MMIYVSGFCGFFNNYFTSPASDNAEAQVKCSFKNVTEFFKKINEKDHANVKLIEFSWSHFVVIAGFEVYLCGFINKNDSEMLSLKIPKKSQESKLIQVSCSERYCHLLTESGECWSYDIHLRDWRLLNNVLGIERELGSGLPCCSESQSVIINNVSCMNHVTVVAANTGIYSVPVSLPFPNFKVLQLSCGKDHAVVLTEQGNIFTWGIGSRGQLGHGDLESQEHPKEVEALSGMGVVSIAAGGWHSCCVTQYGDLYTWGWNVSGQLALSLEPMRNVQSTTDCVSSMVAEPRVVDWPDGNSINPDPVFVKQIDCGTQHTVAILEDNSVWGCGSNKYHQLSDTLPEIVLTISKIELPSYMSNKNLHIVCGAWNTAYIC